MKSQFYAMSATVLLVISHSLSFTGCSQRPASVHFFTGSWNELLTEAKKQNKPIFVEVHTVWCGPCRLMEKQAFPDPNVATLFNRAFINYHIDMEKGEGPMLQKKYAIMAVPTLLYLSPDGQLTYRSAGYDNVNGLIADAEKAVNALKRPSPLSALEADYKDDRRDVAFLRTYLTGRAKSGQPTPDALATYLAQVPKTDWSSAENIALIASHNQSSSSPSFTWLLDHGSNLINDPTKANTRWTIVKAADRILRVEIAQATTAADLDRLIALKRQINHIWAEGKMTTDNDAFLINQLRMEFYERTRNQAGYRPLALAIGNRLMAKSVDSLYALDAYSAEQTRKRTKASADSSKAGAMINAQAHSGYVASELHKLTSAYLSVMEATADLEQALAWSERTTLLMPAWPFLDTQARVLHKLGRKNEAIAKQKQLIRRVKATGEATADYEQTLAALMK